MKFVACAALAAACLVALATTPAEASRGRSSPHLAPAPTQFCGDRYCPVADAAPGRRQARQGSRVRHRGHRYAAGAPRAHQRARQAETAAVEPAAIGLGGSSLVDTARRYIGGNPTGRSSLWCATFMNYVLEHTGHRGTGSNMAASFASYGTRIAGPEVGAIAVMHRGRRGGHVGVVSGVDEHGNPIIVSGNHGHRVAESVYPRGRIYAYVRPN